MSPFGITPDRIAVIASVWREVGDAIVDVRVPQPTAGSSIGVAAVAAFCSRATTICDADGRRLIALGDALAVFNAQTEQSDAQAAVALGDAGDADVR
ncbi:hypothetical protein [Gordonia humi]|uniref:Uncharacterized protein n=1 Tax=Gordonia humi TaxID=686429 RepID=A0A840F4Z4_9ACTN|nr:hypothetical protein [Gordonia humi]MBB4135330.1 hypothetical protein [Gordonia humi]